MSRLARPGASGTILLALGLLGGPAAAETLALLPLHRAEDDACRGPLGEALVRAAGAAGTHLVRVSWDTPERIPEVLRRAGAAGAVWCRRLPGDRVGLRALRTQPSELFETEVSLPAGAPAAAAEALWLRLEFLAASPPGTGRPYPPAPPRPTVHVADDTAPPGPDVQLWPPVPDTPVPPPPAPLPAPPAPVGQPGDVEIVIEAMPGARRPAMIFSGTAENGTINSAPPGTPPIRPRSGRLRLRTLGEANFPEPRAFGLALGAQVPLALGPDLLAALHCAPLHRPWDATAGAATLATWRADLGLLGHFASEGLHVWAGGGSFVALLTGLGGEGQTQVRDRWRPGLFGEALVGYDLGPVTPLATFGLSAGFLTLKARSDEGTEALSRTVQMEVGLGLGIPLGAEDR